MRRRRHQRRIEALVAEMDDGAHLAQAVMTAWVMNDNDLAHEMIEAMTPLQMRGAFAALGGIVVGLMRGISGTQETTEVMLRAMLIQLEQMGVAGGNDPGD